ncbi:synaptic vesicle glycoprotein 2A-like [Cochliomyia hominivorax]
MQHSDDQQTKCLSKSADDLKKVVIKPQTVESELQKLNDDDDVERLWGYEEILEILGFGKTQWILLLICGLLTMTSISAIYSIAVIGISSQCEFKITQKEKGVMMAACVTGIALSTYIWGFVSDIWGRRSVLIWSMFFTNFLQLILMFITNIWLFNFINLVMGISLGGILGPIYPYIGEFNITKYRAIVINYSNMFVSVTAIYVPAISWLVLSSNWSLQITEAFLFKPWRLIILFCMLPGLVGGLVLISFPESPKLLLAHGKHKEALKALYWISKFNTGKKLDSILETSRDFHYSAIFGKLLCLCFKNLMVNS